MKSKYSLILPSSPLFIASTLHKHLLRMLLSVVLHKLLHVLVPRSANAAADHRRNPVPQRQVEPQLPHVRKDLLAVRTSVHLLTMHLFLVSLFKLERRKLLVAEAAGKDPAGFCSSLLNLVPTGVLQSQFPDVSPGKAGSEKDC